MIDFVKSHECNYSKSKWIYRFWHFFMRNFFIMNHIEHIESKKSIDFIVYNQNKIFVIFVRIFHDEKLISNETHFEQWIRINSILSKIENIRKKFISMNMQRIWWTCDMFNEFLMITNTQQIRKRTKNHFIILFIFCRKMINNIENLFERIFEKQF